MILDTFMHEPFLGYKPAQYGVGQQWTGTTSPEEICMAVVSSR